MIVCDDDSGQTSSVELTSHAGLKSIGVDFNYHINAANLGDYFNRNKGISLAKGEWVKFIDDDDLIYPWTINFMVEKVAASKDANTVIFYLRNNFRHLYFPVILRDEAILKFHYLDYGLFHCSLVSAVFLRTDLVKHGAFKFKRFYGDFQIFHDMATNGVFYIYPIELGWYRIHDDQESSNNRKKGRIRFNYLLFSYNYFIINKSTVPYYRLSLGDCWAYIKYAIKHFDFSMLYDACYMYVLIFRKTLKFNKTTAAELLKWDRYYRRKMLYGDNTCL